MAKINPIKLKQDADKLEKAGRFDQAITLYRQVVDDNPRDWNTINKIGDLYAKLEKPREASNEYAKVADFYAKDGFLLKAIALWKKINRLDTTALEPYLNLADLYAKQGLMMEAKSQYQIVVDEYIKRAKMREAGEVLRKMAEIDPGDLKVRSKLADLYTREGNAPRAVEEHVAIAEELNRKGHLAEALQVLEKGLKIDPKSNQLRLELARIHIVQRNHDKAAQYLEEAAKNAPRDTEVLARLGEAYLGAKRVEEAEALFKRLIELAPENQDHRTQMGRVYILEKQYDKAYEALQPVASALLERKEGDKAAALLQQIVQKDPGHVNTLKKLSEIYRALNNESQLASIYTSLSEAHIQAGQMDQAARVLEGLVELEPQNEQHRTKLDFVRKGRGAAPPPAPKPRPAPAPTSEELEEEFELTSSEELPGISAPSARAAAPASSTRALSIEPSGPLSDEDQEFIDEHLAEGKVFRKYGLLDKAADQFEAIIARFPDNLEARQELRDLYEERDQKDKAAEQSLAMAQIQRLRGDPAQARAIEEAARGFTGTPLASTSAAPAVGFHLEEELPLAEIETELPLVVEEAGLEAGAGEPGLPPLDLGEEVATGGEFTGHFIEEEVEAPAEEPPAPPFQEPAFAEEPALGGEPAFAEEELSLDGLGDSAVVEEPPPPPPPPPPKPVVAKKAPPPPPRATAPPPPPPRPAPPAPPRAKGVPSELERLLGEVDSFVAVGFVEDAKEVLRDAAARFPSHPAISRKMDELQMDASAPEPSPEFSPLEHLAVDEPTPEPASEGFDLGAELGELFQSQSAVEAPEEASAATSLGDPALEDIFKEFRKGVDKQLDTEDYDTRYNLGIAYKEMGLIDEAISEFQLAAKDPARVLECSSMLGICFLEKGMPKLAVKWFEKGLKAEGRSEEEFQGLRYDLAGALEAAGDVDQALATYRELHIQNAGFRDVAAKVRELSAASG